MPFWPPSPDAQGSSEGRRREDGQRQAAERATQEQRRRENTARLQGGGIPVEAEERLRALGGRPGALAFTGDLSPDEAALLRRNGIEVLGLVTGSCVYHVGVAYASSYQDTEVVELSGAYNEATRLAVVRLQQEAALLRASGVVGVRLELVRREWSEKMVEVQIVGTAVRDRRAQSSAPWLSDLSGQEWWAVHRAGFEPAGLVWGHCTWFILTTQGDEWARWNWNNQELAHFADALRQCRNRAVATMESQASALRADGVIGVRLARRLDEIRLTGPGSNPAYEREHHNLTLSLFGTAVRSRPGAAPRVRATVQVLSLRDGRLATIEEPERRAGSATFE